jgi:hypothetical protein
MPINDPITAYNAANNIEAHLVCELLISFGIEAKAIEDVSQIGTAWYGGLLPEIHKPQVWIDRSDIERAKPILVEYERQASHRRNVPTTGSTIEVTCEECGKQSSFPEEQKGSVQDCPHCHAFVDVGDEVDFEGWENHPDAES